MLVGLGLLAMATGWAGEDAGGTPPAKPFRLISYNVLEGFRDAAPRRLAVATWLAGQAPDVVAFMELNGYTEERLREEAKAWGHPHAVLLKEKGYPTGLTSRTPISDVRRVLDGFHHGVIQARTAGIVFYVVHLSPSDSRVRRREAGQILEGHPRKGDGPALVGALAALAANEAVVVLGDFNALSPDDREYHQTSGLFEVTRHGDTTNPKRHNLGEDGKLDFRVLERFGEAKFVDVVRRKHDQPGDLLTCPTPLDKPALTPQELKPLQKRIDYILASPGLAATCLRADVLNSAAMDRLSDHYPLLADFAWLPPADAKP